MKPFSLKKYDDIHVIFCLVDHFEPFVNNASFSLALDRVMNWVNYLPKLSDSHMDSCGKKYRHSFFYPIEEYDSTLLRRISDLCKSGYGETEIHLHHDDDTPQNLKNVLIEFKEIFSSEHGLLSFDRKVGDIKYGFIHGNWALDNSRPDGRWCGINSELTILKETGCYADFTMPSAPDVTQTSKINSIYYAIDDPEKPKSHDTGIDAQVGKKNLDCLLLIQGPLTLDWKSRKKGFLPGIENGELGGARPPTMERFILWMKQRICVRGKENWLFMKLHTHGALEKNAHMFLKGGMNVFLEEIEKYFSENEKYKLHYVTAREMYNIIRAAEDGLEGSPDEYRDYELLSISC